MISRSTNGSNRDHQGKFVKGCRPGPGNPHVAKVAQWRSVLTECVTGEDIEAVIRALPLDRPADASIFGLGANVRIRGQSRHPTVTHAISRFECPLLGVKRTFASYPLYVCL